jgi:hypothetical protein
MAESQCCGLGFHEAQQWDPTPGFQECAADCRLQLARGALCSHAFSNVERKDLSQEHSLPIVCWEFISSGSVWKSQWTLNIIMDSHTICDILRWSTGLHIFRMRSLLFCAHHSLDNCLQGGPTFFFFQAKNMFPLDPRPKKHLWNYFGWQPIFVIFNNTYSQMENYHSMWSNTMLLRCAQIIIQCTFF